MPTLTIKIDQALEDHLQNAMRRNLGWNKTLVVRALLGYFLQLEPNEQERLLKSQYGLTPE